MKRVVIIGGGFTGTHCTKNLEKNKNFQVTLIDNKNYFEYTPSVLRTILEPDHVNDIQKKHSSYLENTKIINDEVKELSKTFAITKKGKKIEFDYAIISSGSGYASPIKEEGLIPAARAKELVMYHNQLEEAKKVLIIGGGLVGVELAAEICTHYDDKDITIVHSHSELMERNNPKTRRYAEKFLNKHNVKMIFNERVKGAEGPCGKRKRFITNKGNKITADFSFITVGIVPHYEFMEKNFEKLLNKRNHVIVNEHLQLNDFPNIFVGGDITGIAEEKTAQTAEKHAEIIFHNLKNLESAKPLIKYKSKKRTMVISLGKYDGIVEKGNLVITGKAAALLKWGIERKTMRKYK